MRGVLIVNAFLRTPKFQEIYALLLASAKEEGIELVCKSADEIAGVLAFDKTEIEALGADFCLFWDKDIYLAQRLESIGLPVFNSARAVEVCDDKMRTALALQESNLPTPQTYFAPKTFDTVGYSNFSFLEKAVCKLGLPVIVKEAFGSFGQQVYLCHTQEELENTVRAMGAKPFLMQQFIQESRGRDLRVNVVGDTAVCAMERYNPCDFRSNVTGGGKAKMHVLTSEQAELAVAACKAVGADFAGVDLLFGDEGMLVCEVNSNPHFKSTLDCTGVDLSREIMRYIKRKVQSR